MKQKRPRKVRYQSKGNQFPRITLTGVALIKYIDDEALEKCVRGDLMMYMHIDRQLTQEPWDYESTGRVGYIKADVHDGREFRPLSLEEFFDHREYYFSKTERPLDTVRLCQQHMQAHRHAQLMRTYREHYVKEGTPAADEEEGGQE